MATNHASSPIPYIRPEQILDPYPDRLPASSGVRQHTEITPAPNLTTPLVSASTAHYSFAASVPPVVSSVWRYRFPIASTVLNAIGQVVLALAIAVGTIEPVIGALAALGWMACGLTLIYAQCLSIASNR